VQPIPEFLHRRDEEIAEFARAGSALRRSSKGAEVHGGRGGDETRPGVDDAAAKEEELSER
jgi:hypothetical protein